MMFSIPVFIIICMFGNGIFVNSDSFSKPYYTAAVFEHNRFGSMNDTADDIIQTNLEFYKKAAEVAKSKEADIIVFPEYGIILPGDRQKIRVYLEDIPDVTETQVNPCNEKEHFSKHRILRTLSCIAKSHSIFIVANMGDIKNCEGEDNCPADGAFHFNANIVFDRNGTMVLKYHKEHLFFETGMDSAREQPDPIFETDFGTFATFTCFDILFEKMSKIALLPSVDGIAFPTFWVNTNPQFTSTQLWMSWSLGHNATLLASNIQLPGDYSMGSGIFHGQFGPLAYTLNPDGKSKLVVARIPRGSYSFTPPDNSVTEITLEKTSEVRFDGKDIRKMCSTYVLDYPNDANKDYRCMEEFTTYYNLVKLTEPSGHVEVCHNGMCCSVDYSAENMDDNFYLGVYNGTHNSLDRFRHIWAQPSLIFISERMSEFCPATRKSRENCNFHLWSKCAPQFNSIQIYQSWALGNNCTLIAPNVQIPGYFAVGSGIFHHQRGALAYSYNPDGLSKLVIARVPKKGFNVPANPMTIAITNHHSWDWNKNGHHVKMECSRKLLNDTEDIHNEYRCVEEDTSNYTFVKLIDKSAHLEVCNNGMCCSLDYTTQKLLENFYLGVFNGTAVMFERYPWSEENCLLVRCEAVGENACATFPRISKTIFHHVQLKANFTSQYVYPSLLESRMALSPKEEWNYELENEGEVYQAKLNFKSQRGRKLTVVGLKGRCYDRDPPYKR
ncbi:Pantetheinase like protein [Argiope bruennichi]|uniref:Pantetheinase like protein n=1 Tax=Argiope bruennichi TaxID=94029 RepID=A0A8T0F1N5_ARGBR|nr:Pantetheinase like protein [Argiope bruennichi]